jgi:hypothetical protein
MSFATELVGQPGNWRLRKGDYRALYRLTETEMIVNRGGLTRAAPPERFTFGPRGIARYVRAEATKWGKVVQDAKLTLN